MAAACLHNVVRVALKDLVACPSLPTHPIPSACVLPSASLPFITLATTRGNKHMLLQPLLRSAVCREVFLATHESEEYTISGGQEGGCSHGKLGEAWQQQCVPCPSPRV